jgi:hypothetical protein
VQVGDRDHERMKVIIPEVASLRWMCSIVAEITTIMIPAAAAGTCQAGRA